MLDPEWGRKDILQILLQKEMMHFNDCTEWNTDNSLNYAIS